MKKICVGFMGAFFAFGVVMADDTTITKPDVTIGTNTLTNAKEFQIAVPNKVMMATTNTAKEIEHVLKYGTTNDTDSQGYRFGVTPQTNELAAVEGSTTTDITSISLGNLAATDTDNTPTKTITANTANVAVLQRDKLHVPTGTTGNCAPGSACGYVTTGNAHSADEKIWLKIQ